MVTKKHFLLLFMTKNSLKEHNLFEIKISQFNHETLNYTKSLQCCIVLPDWFALTDLHHSDPQTVSPKIHQMHLLSWIASHQKCYRVHLIKRPWLFWCESKSDCRLMIVDIAYTNWTKGENTPGSTQSLTSLETVPYCKKNIGWKLVLSFCCWFDRDVGVSLFFF